jgi:hypothetical protein
MPDELIPQAVRIALRNAVGGWGPYSVREIDELFNSHGFEESDASVADAGGMRRTEAESFHASIDFNSTDNARRYLDLVDDVLQNYPDDPAQPNSPGQRLRRALFNARIERGLSGHLELPGSETAVASTLDNATEGLWTPQRIRIFLSHTHAHRSQAAVLATELNRSAFSCFVAHDAIEPSRQWQQVIEMALRTCDVLLAYVTSDFTESKWTDQEVGWALGRELVVISIKAGADPYGFFGSYQAVPAHTQEDTRQLAMAVARSIAIAVFGGQRVGANRLIPRMADTVVNAFCASRSCETAQRRFELLRRIPRTAWNDSHVARIRSALTNNQQIRECIIRLQEPIAAPQAVAQLLATVGRTLD